MYRNLQERIGFVFAILSILIFFFLVFVTFAPLNCTGFSKCLEQTQQELHTSRSFQPFHTQSTTAEPYDSTFGR